MCRAAPPAVFDAVDAANAAQSFGAAPGRCRRVRHHAGVSASSPRPSRIKLSGRKSGRSAAGGRAHVLLGRRALLPDPDLPRHARAGRHRFRAHGGRHRRRHRGGGPVCGVAHRLAAGAGHPLRAVDPCGLLFDHRRRQCRAFLGGRRRHRQTLLAGHQRRARSSSSPNCRCCSAALWRR